MRICDSIYVYKNAKTFCVCAMRKKKNGAKQTLSSILDRECYLFSSDESKQLTLFTLRLKHFCYCRILNAMKRNGSKWAFTTNKTRRRRRKKLKSKCISVCLLIVTALRQECFNIIDVLILFVSHFSLLRIGKSLRPFRIPWNAMKGCKTIFGNKETQLK